MVDFDVVATGRVRRLVRRYLNDPTRLRQREVMGGLVLIEPHHMFAPAIHCSVVVLRNGIRWRNQRQIEGHMSPPSRAHGLCGSSFPPDI